MKVIKPVIVPTAEVLKHSDAKTYKDRLAKAKRLIKIEG